MLSVIYKKIRLPAVNAFALLVPIVGQAAELLPLSSPADHIVQQEQQRLLEQRRQQQDVERERTRQAPKKEQAKTDYSASNVCFDISDIDLNGVSLLPVSDFSSLLQSYRQRCLGSKELNQLLQAITQHYFNKGYVTSRAYLPQQNLADGSLTIEVVEGVVQSVKRATDNTVDSEVDEEGFAGLFFHVADQPLNLRDLEQNLEQINRLRSYRATMQLLPGDEAGSSVVMIEQDRDKPWQLTGQVNNSGQPSTGEIQQQVMLGWDSPLGLYDYGYLSYQGDNKHKNSGKMSKSVSGHWDVPLGYWNVLVDASRFKYSSVVHSDVRAFTTTGVSNSQQLTVQRILARDGDSKLRVEGSLQRKDSKNYMAGVLLQNSSRTLAIASLGINHEQYFSGGGLLLSALSYQRGLDAFDSPDDDDNRDRYAPKAQFDSYGGSLEWRQPFRIGELGGQYRTRLVGQYSEDELFGSEQISIGGQYTVRGYKGNSLSGDSGGYWRNDVSLDIATPFGGPWLTRLSPFIGLDTGYVRSVFIDGDKYPRLSGWATGVNANGQHWAATLQWSQPIKAPRYMRDTGEQFEFSVSLFL
ncbi:hemolysin activation/secretion protein [Sinobacterium caligoides]|uniref:Hemolysin activation/secretion protein n=1 Tax=Sinobacterium caligoides TaxID=933926 RepID=A0A3N2E0H8_9GAMM|nr:ShlB/FhaC/HecB family hemolysin secretion/activation protein [Sinobacterium caligoides]ROS05422.1 hemolysin activation/secretion protein [Sinobacterium caligoides]